MTTKTTHSWRYIRSGAAFVDPVRKALRRRDQAITILGYLTVAFPDRFPDGWIPLKTLMEVLVGKAYKRTDTEALLEALLNSGDVDFLVKVVSGITYRYLRIKPGTRKEAVLSSPQIRRLKKQEMRTMPPSTGWRRRAMAKAAQMRAQSPEIRAQMSGKTLSITVGELEYVEPVPKVWRQGTFEETPDWVRQLVSSSCIHTVHGRVVPCPVCGNNVIVSHDLKSVTTSCLCTAADMKRALGMDPGPGDESSLSLIAESPASGTHS